MFKPVVVVGAGLAGLVCARKLHQAGVPVIVVDADDRAGGKLKTDEVGGFLLDRGSQKFFTAYPNASRELDLEALDLKPFKKGAFIYHGNDLHLLEQQSFLQAFKSKFAVARDKTIPKADKQRLSRLSSSLGELSPRQIYRMNAMTGMEYLEEQGFGDEIIDRLFRPLFGGVFLDHDLNVDSRQLAFVWSMMEQGETAVPTKGIEAIPAQIAADIPRYLFRFDSRVSEVLKDANGHACGVRFDTSEVLEASKVVIATESDEAARLIGHPTAEGFKSSICLYFETPTPCVDGPDLVLNGTGEGLVNHVVAVTNAAPSYAPAGKHLAAAMIIGTSDLSDEFLAEKAKEELNNWLPQKGAYMWRFIRAYRLRHAQLLQPVGFIENRTGNATSVPDLYKAGEFTQNSSIDGAIRSGMECAALLLAEREATEAA